MIEFSWLLRILHIFYARKILCQGGLSREKPKCRYRRNFEWPTLHWNLHRCIQVRALQDVHTGRGKDKPLFPTASYPTDIVFFLLCTTCFQSYSAVQIYLFMLSYAYVLLPNEIFSHNRTSPYTKFPFNKVCDKKLIVAYLTNTNTDNLKVTTVFIIIRHWVCPQPLNHFNNISHSTPPQHSTNLLVWHYQSQRSCQFLVLHMPSKYLAHLIIWI
jgi:hypothetical protein